MDSKRVVDRPGVARKRPVLSDSTGTIDRNGSVCSRIGCSRARINTVKGPLIGPDKAKSVRTLPQSSLNGRAASGSSSLVSNVRKPLRNNTPSLVTAQTSKVSSSVKEKPDKSTPLSVRTQAPEVKNSVKDKHLGLVSSKRSLVPKSANPDSSSSKATSLGPRASKSIIVSSSSSVNKMKDVVKKTGESSSSSSSSSSLYLHKGKKTNVLTKERKNYSPSPSPGSGVASVRTRRPTGNYSRTRLLSNHGNGNSLSINEPSNVVQPEPAVDIHAPVSTEFASGSSGASGLMNEENFPHYNGDGLAEVLLALQRIEQYEQILALENNLFLNTLNSYDQHREMRLDIDDMSYEELLALEESMGSVSTALSEEAISKCLKTSIYSKTTSQNKDDVKCSICQEEFVAGDKVGRLRCNHKYHVDCVQQWLRLKNWCPICKAEATETPVI